MRIHRKEINISKLSTKIKGICCFDIGDIMYIIDRIEDNIAVCEKEDGSMTNIPVSIIKGKIEEGAIIVQQGEFFLVDKEKSTQRKKEIDDLMKGMWSYE